MRDIHRSITTWLARRTGRGSTARPPHRSHHRRLTLEPLEGRALLSLTTWTVNSLGDTGTGSGTSGDLRYVITQADQTTGDNTINFTVIGTITLNSALPDLSNTTGLMDIEGPGATSLTVARSSAAGTPDFSVFTVDVNVQAQLAGLTITGGASGQGGVGGGIDNAGTLTVTDSTIDNNMAGLGGGGIYNAGTLTVTNSTIDNNVTGNGDGGGIDSTGTLTVTNCTISNNGAGFGGGGIYNAGTLTVTNSTIDNNGAGFGGGIDSTGTLTVTNCTISNNSTPGAPSDGGGIYVAGTATVTDSTIDNNSVLGDGGGIDSTGTLTVTNCTIAGNSAEIGGGISNGQNCTLTVTNSTIAGNSADQGGGIDSTGTLTVTDSAIDNNSAEFAGGIYVAGTATVTDSTIDNNSAEFGGGICNDGGTLSVTNSTINNNSAGGGGGGIFNESIFNESQEGSVTVSNSTIDNNGAGFGGGIFNYDTLTLTNSTIDNNSAYITRVPGAGGGIFNGGMLTVTDSTIDNNSVNNDGYPGPAGGGIDGGGTVTVINSSINDNDSSGEGGGIYAGTATVINSTIAGNSAGEGGGIYVAGTATVTNSTIADNSAELAGGIYVAGTATVTNSTIADNSANEGGGGIVNGGTLTVTNSTIADNSAGYGGGGLLVVGPSTTLLDNTLIALNTSGTGTPDDILLIAGGTVSSASAYNLIGIGGSGGLVNGTNGNQVGVADPGLGPLAYYGGPTQTIDLLPGSPAIDKGSNALAVDPSTGQPLTTDQRGTGFLRIVNGTVDIGAYEYLPAASDTVAVTWGTQTAPLQTAADGLLLLPQGRTTDLPWLGIQQLQIVLGQPQVLTAADVAVNSAIGVNYGPVTVSGSGTRYTITLAQPINAADRVTITIVNPGVSMFNRRLDVLPGDVNDDGVVNVQDMVAIRNQMLGLLGAVPTIFGDINGDGKVDINDYTAVRKLIGTTLPRIT